MCRSYAALSISLLRDAHILAGPKRRASNEWPRRHIWDPKASLTSFSTKTMLLWCLSRESVAISETTGSASSAEEQLSRKVLTLIVKIERGKTKGNKSESSDQQQNNGRTHNIETLKK